MDLDENFDGPPEVVYDAVTDPRRLSRWLPASMRADRQAGAASPAQGGGVRVAVEGTGAGDGVYQVDVDPATMTVRWRPTDGAGQPGELRVVGGSAGGSRATVSLPATDDDQLRELARTALAALRAEVADQFTAG